MEHVVVTGIGIIGPLGVGREAFWTRTERADSGLVKINSFDTDRFSSNVAGLVQGFDPSQCMPARIFRRMCRLSRMAVTASVEAVRDSGIDLDRADRERIGVIMGTGYGGSSCVEDFYRSLLEDGPRGAKPFLFPETVPNAPASHMAMWHSITGPNSTFCHNDLSAENALLYARDLLLNGQADVVLAGGGDELSSILYSCYDAVKALNKVRVSDGDPIVPKPGGGLVLGEGACVLVMEREDSALRRGGRIYGRMLSGVITGGPACTGHYASGHGQMVRALEMAAESAGVHLRDIDHIDVSANFSRELDSMEYKGLSEIFQERLSDLRVTPLKYLMGDFGGAGALRAAAILISQKQGMTLPSVEVGVLEGSREKFIKWRRSSVNRHPSTVMMLSSTFGGGHGAILFQGDMGNAIS